MTSKKQQCCFTKKISIDDKVYTYRCELEQYCKRLCKAHYEIYTSKDYTDEPYTHSSKEKFLETIKPLEIKGENK